jgi:DNA-binding transcriptional ArsR family regulator
MAESFEAYAELAALRIEVGEIGTMVDALVRNGATEARKQILDEMNSDPALAAIYRLIDGQRGAKSILAELKKLGIVGASQPTVSRKTTKLQHDGLIALDRNSKDGHVFRYTRLDKVLGISRVLRQQAKATKATKASG